MAHPMRARIRDEGAGPARVDIFDDIGAGGWFSEGYTPAAFADAVKGLSGPLDVHINSAGGDVSDGIAIASAIRAYPGRKRTVVDGMAASIASVIAQAGDERIVEPGAMLMIHDPLTACMGNQADFEKAAETLGKHGDNLARQYADRAGGTPEEWRAVMRDETWYTADEAVEAGLADRVGTAGARLPQGVDVESLAARAPGRVMAALRLMPRAAADAAPEPYTGPDPCPTCKGKKTIRDGHVTCPDCKGSGKAPEGAEDRGQGARAAAGDPCKTCGGKGRLPHPGTGKNGVKCPGCGGTGTYDPDTAPDEDEPGEGPGDGGGMAEDRVWELIRAGLRGVRGAVDNSPWDGGKAMAAGAASDDPAAFYAGICAGEKAGDKSTQAAWALPYRYAPGDPPNAAGVKNALARLPQTEGLTNEAEAKKTLQAAMKVVNPDWEPDDSAGTSISAAHALEQYRAALKGATA